MKGIYTLSRRTNQIRSSAIAYFYIDSKGRRWLLMLSLAAMFPLLLATGFSFEATHTITENALVATFLVLYTFAYSPGAGVVPFLYSSEIFPQMLRGTYRSFTPQIDMPKTY